MPPSLPKSRRGRVRGQGRRGGGRAHGVLWRHVGGAWGLRGIEPGHYPPPGGSGPRTYTLGHPAHHRSKFSGGWKGCCQGGYDPKLSGVPFSPKLPCALPHKCHFGKLSGNLGRPKLSPLGRKKLTINRTCRIPKLSDLCLTDDNFLGGTGDYPCTPRPNNFSGV